MGPYMSFPQYVVRDQLCAETIHQLETHQTLVLRFFRLVDPRIPWTAHNKDIDEKFVDDVNEFLVGVETDGICDSEDLEEIWSYVFESLKRARGEREVHRRAKWIRPWVHKHRLVHRNPRDSNSQKRITDEKETKRRRR